VVLSVTAAGLQVLWNRRNERVERLAQALSDEFSSEELQQIMDVAPLLERLAQSI
jgi:DNA-binding MarR family transcriptional regulator